MNYWQQIGAAGQAQAAAAAQYAAAAAAQGAQYAQAYAQQPGQPPYPPQQQAYGTQPQQLATAAYYQHAAQQAAQYLQAYQQPAPAAGSAASADPSQQANAAALLSMFAASQYPQFQQYGAASSSGAPASGSYPPQQQPYSAPAQMRPPQGQGYGSAAPPPTAPFPLPSMPGYYGQQQQGVTPSSGAQSYRPGNLPPTPQSYGGGRGGAGVRGGRGGGRGGGGRGGRGGGADRFNDYNHVQVGPPREPRERAPLPERDGGGVPPHRASSPEPAGGGPPPFGQYHGDTRRPNDRGGYRGGRGGGAYGPGRGGGDFARKDNRGRDFRDGSFGGGQGPYNDSRGAGVPYGGDFRGPGYGPRGGYGDRGPGYGPGGPRGRGGRIGRGGYDDYDRHDGRGHQGYGSMRGGRSGFEKRGYPDRDREYGHPAKRRRTDDYGQRGGPRGNDRREPGAWEDVEPFFRRSFLDDPWADLEKKARERASGAGGAATSSSSEPPAREAEALEHHYQTGNESHVDENDDVQSNAGSGFEGDHHHAKETLEGDQTVAFNDPHAAGAFAMREVVGGFEHDAVHNESTGDQHHAMSDDDDLYGDHEMDRVEEHGGAGGDEAVMEATGQPEIEGQSN
ncbi:hypothetical protein BJ742DRAFT_854004 [Cladochytrium replicatum]|nr:hypothetical protein BJ742DRAFT_854004 [Cladochytrium replicatum]